MAVCPGSPAPGSNFVLRRMGDTPLPAVYPMRLHLMQVEKSLFQARDISYNTGGGLPGLAETLTYTVLVLNGDGTLTAPGGGDIVFNKVAGEFVAEAELTVGDPASGTLRFRLETLADPGSPLVPLAWEIAIQVVVAEFETEFGISSVEGVAFSGRDLVGDLITFNIALYNIYKKGARGTQYPPNGVLAANDAAPITFAGADPTGWTLNSSDEAVLDFAAGIKGAPGFSFNHLTGLSEDIAPIYGLHEVPSTVTLTLKYTGDPENLPAAYAALLDENYEVQFTLCVDPAPVV